MLSTILITGKVCALILATGLLFAWLSRPAEAVWVKKRALPLTVGLFALGMFAPSVFLIYAAIVAAIVACSRSRSEAVAIYVVVMLALPRLPKEMAIGSAYLLAFDKWLFGAVGLAIAWFAYPERSRHRSGWFDWPFIIVMALEVSLARGLNVTSFIRTELVVVLCYIMPYFLITRSQHSMDDVRRILFAICFGAVVQSMIGLFEMRTFFLAYDAIGQRLGASEGLSSYAHQRAGSLRAVGSIGEATTFGLFLGQAFIASLAMRSHFRAKRYWVAALGLIALGLYATNSRGPVLALAVGLIFYDVYRRRYQSLAVKAGLFAMVYAIALMAAQFSPGIAARIGKGGDSVGTADYRHLLLTRGLEQMRQHPIIGVDPKRAVAELADLRQGEGIVDFVNGYIFYGMTTGFPGMIALFMSFVLMAWNMMAKRPRFKTEPRTLEIGGVVFAIAVMTIVTCGTTGFGGRSQIIFYLFIGIGSALSMIYRRRSPGLEEEEEAQPATSTRGIRLSPAHPRA